MKLFRRRKKMLCSDLALALFASATRPDFQERDWNKLQREHVAKEPALFEWATLRLTATWLAINESLQSPEQRFAVTSRYEMLMREFNPGIVKNCDPYIEAYDAAPGDLNSAAVTVAEVFSHRTCGEANINLVEFAYLCFLSLYEAQKRTILSYDVVPDSQK